MNNFKKILDENQLNESRKIRVKGSNISIDFDPDIPNVKIIPPQSGVVEFGTKEELNSLIKILNKIKKEM